MWLVGRCVVGREGMVVKEGVVVREGVVVMVGVVGREVCGW